MKRAVGLNFIPVSIPFSEMDDWQVDVALGERDDQSNTWVEQGILNIMAQLKNDKERCVFLIQILRGLNYNIDHASAAKALGVEWRWYMRIKKSVKDQIKKIGI